MERTFRQMGVFIILCTITGVLLFAAFGAPYIAYWFNSDPRTSAPATSRDWELIDDRSMTLDGLKGLEYTVWEKSQPPYKSHDVLRVYRVAPTDGPLKAPVFIFPGAFSSGMQIASEDSYILIRDAARKAADQNPDNGLLGDDLAAIEEAIADVAECSIVHFLARNGYEVFTMDYRTHAVSAECTPDELAFMERWGWDLFMTDGITAMTHAKAVADADALWLAGQGFGAMLAMNYVSEYDDVRGLILLDGANPGEWRLRIPTGPSFFDLFSILPDFSVDDARLLPWFFDRLADAGSMMAPLRDDTYALSQSMDFDEMNAPVDSITAFLRAVGIPVDMHPLPHYAAVQDYALEHPLDPPIDPVTGDYLMPYNPETGAPYRNYIEWAGARYHVMGIEGMFTQYPVENTALALAHSVFTADCYWPLQVCLEALSQYTFEFTTDEDVADLFGVDLCLRALPGALMTLIHEMVDMRFDAAVSAADSTIIHTFDHAAIDVPCLTFSSRFGLLFWGPCTPPRGAVNVVNGGEYPALGHFDLYAGAAAFEYVNMPTLAWLDAHTQ